MTDVVIAPRVEDVTSDTESVMADAHFRIRPSQTYVSGGQWVLAEWPAAMTSLTGTAVTVKLDANASVPYEIEIYKGGRTPIIHEYRIVPASGSPVSWQDCTQVAGPGSAPAVPSALEARVIALEASIGSVSGGASTLGSITDMSAFMRTVNDDTSAAAARATLGATDLALGTSSTTAAAGDAVVRLTGAQTVAGVKTFSSAPAVPDASFAQAKVTNLVSDLAGLTSSLAGKAATSHTQAASTISDSTTIGRAVLTAASGSAACDAIDAIYSTAVTEVQYSATAPTGAATNGVLVLTPVT